MVEKMSTQDYIGNHNHVNNPIQLSSVGVIRLPPVKGVLSSILVAQCYKS